MLKLSLIIFFVFSGAFALGIFVTYLYYKYQTIKIEKEMIRVLENMPTNSNNKRSDSLNIYFYNDTLSKEDLFINLESLESMN